MDLEELRNILDYNVETGEFRWKVARGNRSKGEIAGNINYQGYRVIFHNKKLYSAARLAWFYVYGRWPQPEIDHINRQRDDNRLENLREADDEIQSRNTAKNKDNRSGEKGIDFHRGKWRATIYAGKQIRLGRFSTKEEAIYARKKAEERYHKVQSKIHSGYTDEDYL